MHGLSHQSHSLALTLTDHSRGFERLPHRVAVVDGAPYARAVAARAAIGHHARVRVEAGRARRPVRLGLERAWPCLRHAVGEGQERAVAMGTTCPAMLPGRW